MLVINKNAGKRLLGNDKCLSVCFVENVVIVMKSKNNKFTGWCKPTAKNKPPSFCNNS